MENTNEAAKLVKGVCPQCGGQLEVDPAQDAAVCPYCGTPYVVSKAVNNFNVQNAHIDHVDHVNVDLKGSVQSLIGLAEREFDKNREAKREDKIRSAEQSTIMQKNFLKMFIILCVVTMTLWIIANALGLFK